MLQNLGQASLRVLDQLNGGADHFIQIVRWDIGRHADRNTIRTVHDQVGNARRQHRGFHGALVVVGNKVDRVLIDVGQHLRRQCASCGLGVTHGRRRVAIHRAEVALTIHHGIAHAEGLRQPHHGVVDR